MEYLDIFWEAFTTFAYWPQAFYIICGALAGYLLCAFAIRMRIRHRRKKHEGRRMGLVEQKGHGGKRKKTASTEYFDFINAAQYTQGNETERKNKQSEVITIERD